MRSLVNRLVLSLAFLIALGPSAAATWSIVTVNLVTGEVGVASATCLESFNLRAGTPVIVVGKGAAAAQSVLDLGAMNRKIISQEIKRAVMTPAQILQVLRGDPLFRSRQYGIVTMNGAPSTFTGNLAGKAAAGVVGQVGDYLYAIQGNVLTANAVITAAETAFVQTNGDMGQRLMAAMQAARGLGGDGRCSCNPVRANSCGAPPPNFTKSAHCGYLLVARHGDTNGACNATKGCAQGKYYMTFNIAGASASAASPDPVKQLQTRFDNWRGSMAGRPDGIHSRAETVESMPADGLTQRRVVVHLRDIDDVPIVTGGAIVTVSKIGIAPSITTIGPVEDNGDGSYSFLITAGTTAGVERFKIKAATGARTATLYPFLRLRLDPSEGLHVGYSQVSARSSAPIPFVVNAPDLAESRYLILGTLNGTQPGTYLGDLLLPLNGGFISVLSNGIDAERLPGTFGRLDQFGRAEGAFLPAPRFMSGLIGARIDWTVVLFDAGSRFATLPVGFDITP